MQDRGAGLAAEKRQAAAGGIRPVARTPPPRGLGGTLPGRVLRMWNVATPPRSETSGWSRWADREEGRSPVAGTGWPKKRTPVAERQQEADPA